jgi:hypothetical protein
VESEQVDGMTSRTLAMVATVACAIVQAPAIALAQPAARPPDARSAGRARQLPDPLSADRPGLGDSSDVVGRGVWQIETGFSLEGDRDGGPSTAQEFTTPLLLVRVGVAERIDVRLGVEGLVADSSGVAGSDWQSGRSDIELGMRWLVADQKQLGVDLTMMPLLSVPAGSERSTSHGYDPTLKLAWNRDLPRRFSLSGNVHVASLTSSGGRFVQHAVSVAAGRELSARWAGYAELFTASAFERNGGRGWIGDAGVTHALGSNVQVDVSGGVGLNDAAPDWFFSAGLVFRGLLDR